MICYRRSMTGTSRLTLCLPTNPSLLPSDTSVGSQRGSTQKPWKWEEVHWTTGRVIYFQPLWQLRIKWICNVLSLLQFGHEVDVNAPGVLFAAVPPAARLVFSCEPPALNMAMASVSIIPLFKGPANTSVGTFLLFRCLADVWCLKRSMLSSLRALS